MLHAMLKQAIGCSSQNCNGSHSSYMKVDNWTHWLHHNAWLITWCRSWEYEIVG